MATLEVPFLARDMTALTAIITSDYPAKIQLPNEYPQDIQDIMTSIFSKDYRLRPNVDKILKIETCQTIIRMIYDEKRIECISNSNSDIAVASAPDKDSSSVCDDSLSSSFPGSSIHSPKQIISPESMPYDYADEAAGFVSTIDEASNEEEPTSMLMQHPAVGTNTHFARSKRRSFTWLKKIFRRSDYNVCA
eukprot:GHVH01001836.1.p1 GENE.GHVH01001836.1~~GHVH01001836.1.p1  ORF type:complete len:192 (+),score=23.94 GHVH01001836.1:838-1413(+)